MMSGERRGSIERTLSISNKSIDALYNEGVKLHKCGQLEEAESCWREGIRRNRKHVSCSSPAALSSRLTLHCRRTGKQGGGREAAGRGDGRLALPLLRLRPRRSNSLSRATGWAGDDEGSASCEASAEKQVPRGSRCRDRRTPDGEGGTEIEGAEGWRWTERGLRTGEEQLKQKKLRKGRGRGSRHSECSRHLRQIVYIQAMIRHEN
eukprot:746111-Hanusia_phi.AAC.1